MKGNMKKYKIKTVTTEKNPLIIIQKLGGYHYWNWKFPFRHFREETLYAATKTSIYKLKIDEN